jgi:hypothetical protein
MVGTGQGSAGSITPLEPEVKADPRHEERLGAKAQGRSQVVDELIDMLDTAERLFNDPAEAWNVLSAEIERRRQQQREWGPLEGNDQGSSRVESGHPGRSTGGAMSSQLNPTPQSRRPFVGFDRERATYERHKADLLKKAEGQWVVIVGDEMVGPIKSGQEAERAGYKRFGLGPLYIKQILAQEPPPIVLPFGLVPCQT